MSTWTTCRLSMTIVVPSPVPTGQKTMPWPGSCPLVICVVSSDISFSLREFRNFLHRSRHPLKVVDLAIEYRNEDVVLGFRKPPLDTLVPWGPSASTARGRLALAIRHRSATMCTALRDAHLSLATRAASQEGSRGDEPHLPLQDQSPSASSMRPTTAGRRRTCSRPLGRARWRDGGQHRAHGGGYQCPGVDHPPPPPGLPLAPG